jgi:diguanylate cyclase (GGDEF)-like protein
LVKHNPLPATIFPDHRVLKTLVFVRYICLFAVGLVSSIVFFAWVVHPFASILPHGWKLMKANTALCTLLSTASLALCNPRFSRRTNLISRALIIPALLLTLAIVCHNFTGRFPRIETLFAADAASQNPGRMSPHATFSFLLLSNIILAIRVRRRPFSQIVDAATVFLGLLILIYASGYFFGAIHLVGPTSQNWVGPQTLFCLFLLTLVTFNYRAQFGIFSVMIGDTIAGKTARIAAPFALILPYIFAVVRGFVVKLNLMQNEYATAIATSCLAILAFCLILLLSRRISALEQSIRNLSLRDELTRLYNRRGFYVLAAQALRLAHRSGNSFSVLFLDVDDLKQVNDTFGHEIGSELLQKMALILDTTIRTTDVVGRLGGDEFAIAATAGTDDLTLIVKRIEAATARVNAQFDRKFTVSFSYGHVTAEPGDTQSLEELIDVADHIMYQAKRDKKALAVSLAPHDVLSSSVV